MTMEKARNLKEDKRMEPKETKEDEKRRDPGPVSPPPLLFRPFSLLSATFVLVADRGG
jgi:hypothetical protein